MIDLSLAEWVAVVSAAIAVLSVSVNYRVMRRQNELQMEQLRASVDVEKTRWLGATLDIFAEAEALALLGPERLERARCQLIAQKLSTQADQGRISFPNLDPARKGQENPAAYQGSRQPAIDAVVLAHDLIKSLPVKAEQGPEIQRLLFACRRILVSEVQKSVDPRRRAAALSAQTLRAGPEVKASYDEVRAVVREMEALKVDKISFG